MRRTAILSMTVDNGLKKEWNSKTATTRLSLSPILRSIRKTKYDKYVREKAGVQDSYGQNPIEWSHFMSKKEIDDVVKSEGLSHTSL